MKNQSDNSTDHIFKWFLPTSIRSRTRYFEFDITSHCRLFFAKEEYFTRQVDFDKQYTISKATIENITSVKLKIYPFTDAPMSNTHEARQIIEKEIGTSLIFNILLTGVICGMPMGWLLPKLISPQMLPMCQI